jgi:predicted metal-dependent enzyme (double-stranded beta helix superfamily)
MKSQSSVAEARRAACAALLRRARQIAASDGVTPASLQKLKELLIGLAAEGDGLFPEADFASPDAHGRAHALDDAANDGFGLYLTVSLPGKEAAPHDHGIWCVNAGLSGTELHRFYRRTDDGTRAGRASIEEIGQVLVEPGTAMAMADHDIHATLVTGNRPARALALYGYAVSRFPSVVWFHPQFGTYRAMPSKRPAVDAREKAGA